jgi:hypothetical protein
MYSLSQSWAAEQKQLSSLETIKNEKVSLFALTPNATAMLFFLATIPPSSKPEILGIFSLLNPPMRTRPCCREGRRS